MSGNALGRISKIFVYARTVTLTRFVKTIVAYSRPMFNFGSLPYLCENPVENLLSPHL